MKKYLIPLALISGLMLSACGATPSTDQLVAQLQEQALGEANAQVGLPAIVNFQEKKLAKAIYELRDQENLINYAYLYNEMSGQLVYLGECIGYGLPYATQYSAPEKYTKFVYSNGSYNWITLPQAEPNGLFMPTSASGTWVMLVDPQTKKPRPVYVEPNVIISPFKLK